MATMRHFVQRLFATDTSVSHIVPWRRKLIYTRSVFQLNEKCFHISALNLKKRKTVEEKKHAKYLHLRKNQTSVLGVIDVWFNMTVSELASSCKRDLENIQEAMSYCANTNNLKADSKLGDMKIVKQILNKCGYKMNVIPAPSTDSDTEKDRDVLPRGPPLPENLKDRPPVVTVMGHVDHGKTTLLDSLRGASVAAGEAGGITQHIGAFMVTLDNDEKVTFLDTPGHAAFSAMRARGAHLTDIIVLVVAADDGVMEQTKEVLNLAKEANVPIIVAVNKIDKPSADPEHVKRELGQYGLALEGFGGDTIAVGVSALKGTNLDGLTEAVSTQATLLGLKGEYDGAVEGVVVESKIDPRRGKLSTAIITRGTLRKGCVLVSGQASAKVRALFDHAGQPVDEAPPGTPVEVLGWRELPLAGDLILEVESERRANSVIRWRAAQSLTEKSEAEFDAIALKQAEHVKQYLAERNSRWEKGHFRTQHKIYRDKETGPEDLTPCVNVIIKGDVHGSVEVILDVLETYHGNDICRLNIIHYAVGDVNENDIELAQSFNAIIYAFSVNVPTVPPKKVSIRKMNVIYRLVDDLKKEISDKLPLLEVEEVFGEANVLELFEITEGKKKSKVIGCRCTKGVLKKSGMYKVVRNNDVLGTGYQLESMRHLKNEVDTIKNGVECGLRLNDQLLTLSSGDTIICYKVNMAPQETDWYPGF